MGTEVAASEAPLLILEEEEGEENPEQKARTASITLGSSCESTTREGSINRYLLFLCPFNKAREFSPQRGIEPSMIEPDRAFGV